MLRQKLEIFRIVFAKKAGGKNDIEQINEIIAKLNAEGKRVVGVQFAFGQNISVLYEYEE